MTGRARVLSVFGAVVAAGLVISACGGADTTPTQLPPAPKSPTVAPAPAATVQPSPTPTTAPAATATPTLTAPATTPTRPASFPTAAPATPVPPTAVPPTPTPIPSGIPTPIVKPGKRGGTLSLRAVVMPVAWDTFDSRGSSEYHVFAPMLNNLIWPDPYGDGKTLVGDVAERWQISADGRVLTFFLRKDVKFHDGQTVTAQDVAYNFDRGRTPRSSTMTGFRPAFAPIDKIETPDQSTVRLTLPQPSNALLQVIGTNSFLMFPASLPFPEKQDQWKASPVGSGPFKFKSIEPNVKIDFIRNDAYWKPGLPYVDSIVFTAMNSDIAGAAFRAKRLDAAVLDSAVIQTRLTPAAVKESGFLEVKLGGGIHWIYVNRSGIFADQRVRQAVNLAIDRQVMIDLWLQENGDPYAAPLLPTDLGGQWGLSRQIMKGKPGFGSDKAADLVKAKQLLSQAGVDPTKETARILGHEAYPPYGDILERNVAALGFKTRIETPATADRTRRLLSGEFDLSADVTTFQFDDPQDYLAPWVVTSGPRNWGKWSNPQLDSLLTEEDRTLDVAKRADLINKAQETILDDAVLIPVAVRKASTGRHPWVKNYPAQLPLLGSPFYRWEQVYIER